MLNQIVLVGRLVENPKVEKEDGKEKSVITLAVQRSYKNEDDVYETDFINCVLWNGIASNTAEYCNKGDLIGVKGRVQGNDGKIEIIAKKVTFLSSKKHEGVE